MNVLRIFLIVVLVVIVANILVWSLIFLNVEPVDTWYHKGLLIKLKPYAFAFVHGQYKDSLGLCNDTRCIYFKGKTHFTAYNYNVEPTEIFVSDLYKEGYTKIWGTWCHAGDSDVLSNYSTEIVDYYNCSNQQVNYTNEVNGTIETGSWFGEVCNESWTYNNQTHTALWPQWVDRAKSPGLVFPIWVGLGFVRVIENDRNSSS